ncbi:hypothetical protein [Rathayibacter tanaceti]|uniref:Uncharacterized protein n=1 Tax=Rathayibacter tanaceti TaxID=1671680 RepID=A0AAE6RJX6_9MICO|nr:hypothetical protein [Rathayibacter tanaceti]QHC55421.1 hypothetical protein GSU10_07080 [Rathayibacter tanaceti]
MTVAGSIFGSAHVADAQISQRSNSQSGEVLPAADEAIRALDSLNLLATDSLLSDRALTAPEVDKQARLGGEKNSALASETLSESDGLSISTPQGEVGMTPANLGKGRRVDSGVMLFPDEHANVVMTSSQDASAAAGYVVIPGADSPTEYRFSFTANNAPAELELTSRGGVLIKDEEGNVLNSVAPPWARGSDGADVETWYEVDGDELVQHVQHAGASYPVVADPSLECDAALCTLLYSRSDTQRLANESNFAAAVLSAACGSAAWACGLAAGVAIDAANRADNEGKCVGIRHLHYVAAASFPVVEPCRE